MEDHVNFLELQSQGEVLYLHVDRSNIHMIYVDHIDSAEYYFIMDKGFVIEAAIQLEVPEVIGSLKGAFWFDVSYLSDRSLRFSGETSVNGKFYTFHFDRKGKVVLKPSLLSMRAQPTGAFNHLIPDITVENIVSYKNHIFLVGLDEKHHEQAFVHIKTEPNTEPYISRLYYLKHGLGDLKVNTVCVDKHENSVYLGGEILFFDEEDYVCSEFFIDNFSLH